VKRSCHYLTGERIQVTKMQIRELTTFSWRCLLVERTSLAISMDGCLVSRRFRSLQRCKAAERMGSKR